MYRMYVCMYAGLASLFVARAGRLHQPPDGPHGVSGCGYLSILILTFNPVRHGVTLRSCDSGTSANEKNLSIKLLAHH